MLPIFIIDFDNTFVSVESLDELVKIALEHSPDREKVIKKIDFTYFLRLKIKHGFG